jgi:hypothetical protein
MAENRSFTGEEFIRAASMSGAIFAFWPTASMTITWFSATNPRFLCFVKNSDGTAAALRRRCWSRLLVR